MALFNYATKEITLKIVYYGPGLSGKTTNIEYLHSTFDPKSRGKLLSLSTEADRTLFFDFLPVEIGKIKEFSIRFQLYTVPGQVRYNSTRKLVLKGADAVVFVADSQEAMKEANIESYQNMKENLLENGLDINDIPIVYHYNKRDLPDIQSVDAISRDINPNGASFFEGVAIEGKGVEEAFQAVTKQLLKHIARKHRIDLSSKETMSVETPSLVEEEVIEELSPLEAIHADEMGMEAEETVEAGIFEGEGSSLEELHAEVVSDIDEDEAVEADIFEPGTGSDEINDVPSLEELQEKMARELEDDSTADAEAVLSKGADFEYEGEDDAFVLEEPSIDDTAGSSFDDGSDDIDLVSSEFDDTPTETMDDLQDQEEVMESSTIEDRDEEMSFEIPEEPAEQEPDNVIEEEPEQEDESIESIYKAFMTEEEEDTGDVAESTPEPDFTPPPPIVESTPEVKPSPSEEIEITLPEGSEEEEPAFEEPETEAVESAEFNDFSSAISEMEREKPAQDTRSEKLSPVSGETGISEATRNVILDEINALSKSVGKMGSAMSSFKSELSVLADRIADIEKSISSISEQADEIKEAVENGSASPGMLTSQTLETIMQLKSSIDKAKKKKFWLFFS
ncbi:MAG: GTPase domain-containing protein [Nitrospirota bacterium]|nr:MAG: GTPase domain-containing protein [Nitrospirota bacterium]